LTLRGATAVSGQIDKLSEPKTSLVETPFLSINDHGQRTSGYIDLSLETNKGAVIIDHKSFLGKRADWPDKALSYSGQRLIVTLAIPGDRLHLDPFRRRRRARAGWIVITIW
jgi:hypothetical protein